MPAAHCAQQTVKFHTLHIARLICCLQNRSYVRRLLGCRADTKPISPSSSFTRTRSSRLHPVARGCDTADGWCSVDAVLSYSELAHRKLQRLWSIGRREQRPALHPLISDLLKSTSCFLMSYKKQKPLVSPLSFLDELEKQGQRWREEGRR